MRKRFMHIGAMEKGKTGRWKFLQNEDVDIEEFAETIAQKSANRIGFMSFNETRAKEIKHAILTEIQEIVTNDSNVSTKSKKKR